MDKRRLFFALWPDERQRELLRDALRPVLTSLEGDHVDRRNWHVTLVFIGAFPEEQVPFLQEAVEAIRMEPVRLRFDSVVHWHRPRIACLQPVTTPQSLTNLVASLEYKLQAFDVQPEKRAYRPHITVAKRARVFEELPLARPLDLEWERFELVESLPSDKGSRYVPLKQ